MIEKLNKILSSFGAKIGLTKAETQFIFSFLIVTALAVFIGSYYSTQKTNELNETFKSIDLQYDILANQIDSLTLTPNQSLKLEKINLNRSSLKEIEAIPGIGEKTAIQIVTYREEISRFKTNRDLLKIKGIGEAKLKRILPFLTPDSLLISR